MWTYVLAGLAFAGGVIGWASHPGSDLGKQLDLGAAIVCQFAVLGASALQTSLNVKRRGASQDGLVSS
jgi:hypothetical protein